MTAFFTALYTLFSTPAIVGIISACDAGNHICSIAKAINTKLTNNSIESKLLNALDCALESTCTDLGWEYDSLVVHELGEVVHTVPLNSTELAGLLSMYVGPAFTSEVIEIWIDHFDQIVASDQILTNYLNTKMLRSLKEGSSVSVVAHTLNNLEEDQQFQKIMMFSPSNTLVFDDLRNSILNGKKILPFVGAGISAFAYKTWKSLLLDLADSLDPAIKNCVLNQIENHNLLDAAQSICDCIGKTLFFASLRRFYAEEKINDNELKKQAAYYIPRICDGNCITTNYDRVLEHSYILNSIAYDMAGVNDTLKLATYYREQNNKGLIFKIHGDILSNNDNILLSRDSYEKHYSKGSELRKQLERWLVGKTFLFIGASLFNDEPIHILTDLLEEGFVNYAIYPCSRDQIAPLREHFDALGILPIFYDKSDHTSLTIILKKLLD